MTEYITKEQAENILAKLNGMRDAQRDPNGDVVYTPEGVRKAINLAFEQGLEVVGYKNRFSGAIVTNIPSWAVESESTPLYALKGDSK
jgi:hypothetical protein